MEALGTNGEEVVGRCHLPQYLLLAHVILVQPLGELLQD